jgi:stage III sporulation protein AC
MLDVSLILKIFGVGLLLVILDKVLKESGKGDIATYVNWTGALIILMMIINLISRLLSTVRTMFQL